MLQRSYAPYSRFSVGAALECEDGEVITGCNVENAAYGSSICAERTALVKAVSEGKRSFRRIAIVGSGDTPCWPCGACRQMLSEFSPSLEILVVSGPSNAYEKTSLTALLPHSFGPKQLGK
jgi:cytidine deaminase